MEPEERVYPTFLYDIDNDRLLPIGDGMPLRDKYAGDALKGILSNPSCDPLDCKMVTNLAFTLADLMMERRKI